MALLLGLLFAALPIRFDVSWKTGLTVALLFVYAKNGGDDGGGSSGSGSGGDDGGGNSGHGSGGDDGGGNSGHGKSGDDGDDNSGHGNANDDDDGDDDDGKGRGRGGDDDDRISSEKNIAIQYSNGWHEQIRNGRYRLTDPKGRTVRERRARPDDRTRMRMLLGQ